MGFSFLGLRHNGLEAKDAASVNRSWASDKIKDLLVYKLSGPYLSLIVFLMQPIYGILCPSLFCFHQDMPQRRTRESCREQSHYRVVVSITVIYLSNQWFRSKYFWTIEISHYNSVLTLLTTGFSDPSKGIYKSIDSEIVCM